MIGYFLNEGPVTNFEEANKSDLKLFSNMYREMAKEGVFLPPSQFEGTFYQLHILKMILRKLSKHLIMH